MKLTQKQTCACKCQCKKTNTLKIKCPQNPWVLFTLLFFGVVVWFTLYHYLAPLANYLTYSLFQLKPASRLGSALAFFLYDTPKVFMLLFIVIFFVGLLRSFITPEKTRRFLAGKSEFVGNILASFLGIITPFCSCSAIPLFIGFITAGVPLGVTFSFLVAAPMVNEIALILLYGLLGFKVALIYLVTGLLIAIISGLIIGKLHMENHIEDWVNALDKTSPEQTNGRKHLAWHERFEFAFCSVGEIIGRVWIFMILGIAIGAGIHGYVPESLMASIMGKGHFWSVPLAVLIGVPMYSNAAGIIPIVQALLGKGAALGTTLAFMMAVTALSLPEMLILRKVLKPKLIATFIAIVTLGILMMGYLFNGLSALII